MMLPAAVTGLLGSCAASCAAAARSAGDREHPHRGDGGQLRPSHAFPGGTFIFINVLAISLTSCFPFHPGRTKIPDDTSRIVQSHPRLDTIEERRLASEREAEVSRSHHAGPAVSRSHGNPAVSGNGPLGAPRPLGRDSAKESGGEDGSPPPSNAKGLPLRIRPETAVTNPRNGSRWESNGFDRGEDADDLEGAYRPAGRLPPLGGVGAVGGHRGRRGRAAATSANNNDGVYDQPHRTVSVNIEPPAAFRNDEARDTNRHELARGDRRRAAFKGDVFDAIKKPVSEKDVADAICRRADEESGKTYFIGSKVPSLEQKLVMFAIALVLAILPPMHR